MSEPQPKDYETSTTKASMWVALGNRVFSSFTGSLLLLVIGGFLTYQLGLNAQIQLTGKQKRQQAYSELMGQRIITTYLGRSILTTDINEIYFQYMRHLTKGSAESSFYSELVKREVDKSESRELEAAKSLQKLYEILGVIRSSFHYSTKLRDLIYHVSFVPIHRIESPNVNLNAKQLQEWKEKTIKDYEENLNEYRIRFDKLLKYLEHELDKEAG